MRTPSPGTRIGLQIFVAFLTTLGMVCGLAETASAKASTETSAQCGATIPRCPVLVRAKDDAVGTTASTTSLAASPTTLSAGKRETLTASVAPAVTVAGTTYVLTGSVVFYDGATVLGTAQVAGNVAVLADITLAATATHTLTAAYSGDTTYASSVSSPVVMGATLLPVTVTLAESGSTLAPDHPVTLTATITPISPPPLSGEQNPSGYVLFYAGSSLITGQVAAAQGPGNTAIASTVVSSLAAGNYAVTAYYSGDPTFGAATSNALNLQSEDFTVGCAANNITMAQGATQTVGCNVALLGGLTGTIEVVCAEQNAPQVGAIDCSFSPNTVINSGATTLTVITQAPSVATAGQARGGWLAAGICLLLMPICLRLRRRGLRFAAWCLLLAGLAGSGLGCSNSVPTGHGETALG
ncbi:MAG TPA: Ig-like domain-containing protein, partial [Acidobacteriaceae bacterium]|nr:Ig-like domain-containing protein [Acidobacteriaceae bacterium]